MTESVEQKTEECFPAVVSILLGFSGILCFITPIPGLIVGIWALHSIGRSGGRLRGKGLAWFGICVSLITTLLQANLMFGSYPPPGVRRMHGCVANLMQQGSAIALYADDNNGLLPLAANWCDALKPGLIHKAETLTCPALPGGQVGGYAFNSALGGQKPPSFYTSRLLMVFESKPWWNLHGQREALLKEPRHWDEVSLLFVDRHVVTKPLRASGELMWDPAKLQDQNH